MKYGVRELLNDDTLRSDSEEEGKQYRVKFEEAKKRLPKEFLDIYESFHRFDDADVLDISIITELAGFTDGFKNTPPMKIKLIIRDADMRDTLCEILLEGVKETAFIYNSYENGDYLDDFLYDKLLIEDDSHVSWEIEFAGFARLKVVFKRLCARILSREEVDEYKKPVKTER